MIILFWRGTGAVVERRNLLVASKRGLVFEANERGLSVRAGHREFELVAPKKSVRLHRRGRW